MKNLILVMLLSVSSFASVVDMQCEVSRPITIQTNWGLKSFRQPIIRINSITQQNFSAFGSIEDRFGSNIEFFNRLWPQNNRCFQNEVCFGTDFSSFRGLSFRVPKESFERRNLNFTMNLRSNSNNRSVFARCNTRSY